MAKVFYITGGLGSGKTLAALDRIRSYLSQGRRVATNVNLNLEHLCNAENKHSRVMRIPDAPTIGDLRAIGYGSDTQADHTHGLLVLDELGTWFNARDFGNKGRMDVIKWMIHMRKRRWDVCFIVQDFGMVDKQARGNIAQYLVTCLNSKDSWLFRWLPKFHVATVRSTSTRSIDDRWIYSGKDLYQAYDTEQLFHTTDDDGIIDSDAEMSAAEEASRQKNGLYCLLPPGYFAQEEKQVIESRFAQVNRGRKIVVFSVLGLIFSSVAYAFIPEAAPAEPLQELADPGSAVHIDQAPGSPLPPVFVPPSVLDDLRTWRMFSYTRINGKTKVEITDGHRIFSMAQVAELGVQVRYVGNRSLVLADRTGDTVTLKF